MLLAYLAHPISDPRGEFYVERNIRRAEEIALCLWKAGVACICPGMNTKGWGGALTFEQFMDGDLELMRRCDLVVLAPGWGKSRGASIEAADAIAHGIPTYQWPFESKVLYELAAQVSSNAIPFSAGASGNAGRDLRRVAALAARKGFDRSSSDGGMA